jgi:hypothetical protein
MCITRDKAARIKPSVCWLPSISCCVLFAAVCCMPSVFCCLLSGRTANIEMMPSFARNSPLRLALKRVATTTTNIENGAIKNNQRRLMNTMGLRDSSQQTY